MKTEINVSIGGMHCDNCIETLNQLLSGLPGTSISSVALGEVVVTLDESQTSKSDLFSAIANCKPYEVTGYAVTA